MRRPQRIAAWTLGLTIALVLTVTGVVGVAVVRYGPLHRDPWALVFLVSASLGALSCLVLALVKARDAED